MARELADRRERAARRFRTIARIATMMAEHLDSDEAIADDVLAMLLATGDRLHRAVADIGDSDGARREWVLHTIGVLAALFSHSTDDEAFEAWLEFQAVAVELDGPFPDLTQAFVDDANRDAVIAAARALVAPKNAGRGASGSVYGPVADLFARLPDGAGASLQLSSLGALRKLIERVRKERATDDVARSSDPEHERFGTR